MGSFIEWRAKRRLPKGFGSIRRLSGNRKNKYAVHPTMAHRQDANETDGQGEAGGEKRKTLCYVPDWEVGYKVLVLYNVGKYEKGMEKKLVNGEWKAQKSGGNGEGEEQKSGGNGEGDVQESGGSVGYDPLYEYAVKILEGIEIIRAGGDVSDVFRLMEKAEVPADASVSGAEADTGGSGDKSSRKLCARAGSRYGRGGKCTVRYS